jgi:hypothetical protein
MPKVFTRTPTAYRARISAFLYFCSPFFLFIGDQDIVFALLKKKNALVAENPDEYTRRPNTRDLEECERFKFCGSWRSMGMAGTDHRVYTQLGDKATRGIMKLTATEVREAIETNCDYVYQMLYPGPFD